MLARLVARTLVAEKALQLLFARAQLPEDAKTLLQLNLAMQQGHLPEGLVAAGLSEEAVAAAQVAYASAVEAVVQAAESRRYSPPAA